MEMLPGVQRAVPNVYYKDREFHPETYKQTKFLGDDGFFTRRHSISKLFKLRMELPFAQDYWGA